MVQGGDEWTDCYSSQHTGGDEGRVHFICPSSLNKGMGQSEIESRHRSTVWKPFRSSELGGGVGDKGIDKPLPFR